MVNLELVQQLSFSYFFLYFSRAQVFLHIFFFGFFLIQHMLWLRQQSTRLKGNTMIANAIKELKQRQQALKEQIKSLQAEAGKLDKALRVLAQISEVVRSKAPQQPVKHKKSSAGSRAIVAAMAQTAKVRIQIEAEAKSHLLPELDHRQSNFGAEKAEQEEKAALTMSQRVPCTCGGINQNCMYCGGTGMREPS